MSETLRVLMLLKDGGERFVFRYDAESGPELLRTLGRFAADKELSFSWYDAAVLSQKHRRLESA